MAVEQSPMLGGALGPFEHHRQGRQATDASFRAATPQPNLASPGAFLFEQAAADGGGFGFVAGFFRPVATCFTSLSASLSSTRTRPSRRSTLSGFHFLLR